LFKIISLKVLFGKAKNQYDRYFFALIFASIMLLSSLGIIVQNTFAYTMTSTIAVGYHPETIVANPNTDMIYVANQLSNTVSVIDGATDNVVDTITVGSDPWGVGVDPSTNTIYVANFNDDTVSVIDGNIPPQPPTNLTATAQLLKINLSWTAPTSDGGTPVTRYMIERSTDNGSTWSTIVSNTGSTGTTYSDTNVLPLTSYTYRVSAINDVGTGNPSNTASALTPSVSVPRTPVLP
jgi:YVTN family beta-propeller protein